MAVVGGSRPVIYEGACNRLTASPVRPATSCAVIDSWTSGPAAFGSPRRRGHRVADRADQPRAQVGAPLGAPLPRSRTRGARARQTRHPAACPVTSFAKRERRRDERLKIASSACSRKDQEGGHVERSAPILKRTRRPSALKDRGVRTSPQSGRRSPLSSSSHVYRLLKCFAES